MSATLSDRLRKFDSQSAVSKEFRVYTAQGAILSLLTVGAILYFVWSEISYNFAVVKTDRVHVNASSPAGMEMEFEVSFPLISCNQLSVDSNDPAGQSQSLHLDHDKHHVWKHRFRLVDDHKHYIGEKVKGSLEETMKDEDTLVEQLMDLQDEAEMRRQELAELLGQEECGSCYGAGEEGECCDSCEDVRRAYRRKGWVLQDVHDIKQCQAEEIIKEGTTNEQEGEGCTIHGIVAISSGGGNVHIAPGEDAIYASSGNLMEMLFQTMKQWNVTHAIHKIRFGPEYPEAVYQLDGENRMIMDTHGMYQYYFQIVPTRYRFLNGTVIQTNQYSVTEHLRHVNPGSNRGLPGVFFFYEVSPLHVEISEEYRKGWVAFFTSVCAVVGGVVTLMGMLDQFLFTSRHKSRELAR